jgi:hypothetical protein
LSRWAIPVFDSASSGIINPGFGGFFLEENQVEGLLERFCLGFRFEQVLDFLDFRFI